MSDDFVDWWYADAGDRRMQRKLEEEIDSAYASQAREASAIRSQMSQLQGTLEQRIDRLAKAFDAFVELSDVRAELTMFEPETSVRNATKRLLPGLLRSPDAPPPLPADLPECRGYWLRPAVTSLVAAISGDEAGAASALTAATGLDELRTAMFLAAGLALARRAPRAEQAGGAEGMGSGGDDQRARSPSGGRERRRGQRLARWPGPGRQGLPARHARRRRRRAGRGGQPR